MLRPLVEAKIQPRQIIFVAALILAIALPIACFGISKSPGVQIRTKASPSVVRLKTLGTLYTGEQEISWGTGFIISNDGLVLTCSHVVPEENLYKIIEREAYFENGVASDQFKIIERDQKSDLAIVQLVNRRPLQALPVGNSDGVDPGEELYILGYPLNYPLSIVPGLLSTKLPQEGRWLTDGPLNPGNSGGPAFTSDGYVVAIAVGGVPKAQVSQGGLRYKEVAVQGINHLIPINVAKDKLLSSFSVKLGSLLGPTLVEIPTPSTINRSYTVSETNDQHPIFLGEYTRGYERIFQAEPGYKITRADIAKLSATRVSAETLAISPDGSQVKLRFSLTSGPMVDRYRGWLHASIETTQVEVNPIFNIAYSEPIYPQNGGPIFDRENRLWAQTFKIDKSTRTLSFETGSTTKHCVPVGDKGAWVSIIFVDEHGNYLGRYDNLALANVHNARNVNKIEASLAGVSDEDMMKAKAFIPIVRGAAGC